MKFTLKNWRKKDKSSESSSSPPSPGAKKLDLTLVKVHSGSNARPILVPFPSSPMSFVEMVPCDKGPRPNRLRSKSASTPGVGRHGPAADAQTGPPENGLQSPPQTGAIHESSPLTPGLEKVPRRPPRPPQHLLPSDTPEGTHFSAGDSQNGTSNSPSTQSPTPSPSRIKPIEGTPSPLQHRPKRPIPELEGVWREFLQDVEEDFDPFEFRGARPTDFQPWVTRKVHPASAPTTPLKPKRKSTSSSPRTHLPSRPSAIQVSSSEPGRPKELDLNYPIDDPEISLADMFPAPPPLSIRKRPTLAPLQLSHRHRSSERKGSLPALSPKYSSYSCSSPDLTPIATPSTPRFAQQQLHTARRSPSSGYPHTPSFEHKPPCPKLYASLTESSEDLPRRQLRNTCSSSHLRSIAKADEKPAYHRPTSSESSSDQSCINVPLAEEMGVLPRGELNYLRSCGRKPSQSPITQTFVPIQRGLAL